MCPGSDKQCATVPAMDFGFCYDPMGCECHIVESEANIQEGQQKESGMYELYSIATNEMGFSPDMCSFRLNIVDQCDPNGPKVACVPTVYLSTRSSCVTEEGEKCVVFDESLFGSCSDYSTCSCVAHQESEFPQPGTKLTKGTYSVRTSAVNEMGYTSSSCATTIVVN